MVLVALSCSLALIGLSAVVALYVCRRPAPAQLKHQQAAHPGANGQGPEGRMVLIVRSPSGATGPVITSGAPSPEDTDPDIIPSKHERRPLRGFMKIHRTPPQRRRRKRTDDGGGEDADEDDKEAEEPLTNHRGSTPVLHSTPPMVGHGIGHPMGHATLPLGPKDNPPINNVYMQNSFSHSNNSIAHKGVTACSQLGSIGPLGPLGPLGPAHAMERLMMNGSTKVTLAHNEPITTSNRIQESCI
ncbi:V-type proton ATPase catalytic subunit A [Frankliniella fusca]|uniref:V-type proton ATPase catalytic subunit A n=1 Tax=Frankliniella fusca TaxID=407009 RepID=A0AAE1LUQ7_9NEOP|nr:V-type proton ATPase catalytic subunit A [Frankliniella fusca]